MKEQFKTFLSQLSKTTATLDYFVDYNTIQNVYNFTTLAEFIEKVKKEKTIKF